jgi:hypothetical protein
LEDKLAKIAVCDNQNTSLFPGDFKDILIGKTWGIAGTSQIGAKTRDKGLKADDG